MKKQRVITILSLAATVFVFISVCTGLFYTTGGERASVQNIYGQTVELFGDGIYTNNSMLKATTAKGTDAAYLVIAPLLMITTLLRKRNRKVVFIHAGLLGSVLYYSACTVFGISYNRIFLVYLLMFSSSLFGFILTMASIWTEADKVTFPEKERFTKTAIFIIIGGCSVLVWLMFILPAVIAGKPIETIEIYTTEPTYVLDLGIILPSCITCGIMLLRRKTFGLMLAPVLLTFIVVVGLCVIGQTVVGQLYGVAMTIPQLVSLVGSFVVLAVFAVGINLNLLKYLK